MMHRRIHEEQDGIALMTALLAVVILAGLSVVFVGRSLTETRASSASRDLEGAVHVAESAADLLVHQLSGAMAAGASADADFVHDQPDDAEDRQWARGLLEEMRGDNGDSPASTWVDTPAGQAYAVQPADEGTVEPVILAVGAVPSFDAERARTRVLRIEIDQDHYRPDFAFLTNGLFDMSGNPHIVVDGCDAEADEPDSDACVADVHANGGVDLNGVDASQIEGTLTTAEGSCAEDAALMGCHDADDGVTREQVPEIRARDFYPSEQPDDWYDLCPGGVIREWSADGPCASTAPIVWESENGDSGSTESRGWSWKKNQGWKATAVESGTFYVHQADAEVTGTADGDRQQITLFIESDPQIGAGSTSVTGGSLTMRGNPRLDAAVPDVLFVADRDIQLSGNGPQDACDTTGTHLGGLISAGEQVGASGTVGLGGSIVEQSLESNVKTVKEGALKGTMCLDYDADMAVELAGYWVITYWNEL